ncbi:hypothetical protein [Nonomuraea dietziae]|uniref:hypothetical protein n=1 Tax=Nonomuraea dietziae TaxID=65515 RepID=UPI00340800B9
MRRIPDVRRAAAIAAAATVLGLATAPLTATSALAAPASAPAAAAASPLCPPSGCSEKPKEELHKQIRFLVRALILNTFNT